MTRFDQLKPTFWDAGPGEPLDARAFAHAGRELGVRLPLELGELLGLRNGGTVAAAFDAFPTSEPTSYSGTHVPFDHLLGVGGRLSILDSPYLSTEWDLPKRVVVLSGDGHTWIALDYRRSSEPSVTWFDVELASELALAPTFRAFAEGLVPSADFPEE
ncbi:MULTISPECIES: SMI1/KNR4 family protein [unclassified Amycolatopsis]|uniref:SMI1/KNR4 family protein n=1 Tax=unclassified Amycolatopsis TaxID=2618356 RepID=UPI002875C80A|nr:MULTISPECIES: SMI1/KNR4 family protein [unclassified Amycolatopsis]MDS0139638.1 SMI1/KNR4 family protein [Amycolatopsis sp. 505]MDS0145061.1 SMI1/KNR4 family protein [Amycolatopsis sp. CM201R]